VYGVGLSVCLGSFNPITGEWNYEASLTYESAGGMKVCFQYHRRCMIL